MSCLCLCIIKVTCILRTVRFLNATRKNNNTDENLGDETSQDRTCTPAHKQHVVSWSDASGVSRKLCGIGRVDDKYYYTESVVPQHIWDQLLETGDHQIGFQEMLAVVMLAETFSDLLTNTLWSCFMDNQGVLLGLIKEACRLPEVNFAIARLWIHMAEEEIGLQAWRVESKANVADGPTREYYVVVNMLNA